MRPAAGSRCLRASSHKAASPGYAILSIKKSWLMS